jgi:hypothetical protein
MASEDSNGYRMDPAEMLGRCSVGVVSTGEDVVVEIINGIGPVAVPALSSVPSTHGTPAIARIAPNAAGLRPAHLDAA